MNRSTLVVVPSNRSKDEELYKQWCLEHISYYSTELTWKYDEVPVGNGFTKRKFLTFWFGEPCDATAFRIRFGL